MRHVPPRAPSATVPTSPRRDGRLALPSRFTHHSREQPDKPEDARDDAVSDISAPSHIARKLKAQSTVDYAQCDQDASEPDVSIGGCATLSVFLVAQVMDYAEDGLEE